MSQRDVTLVQRRSQATISSIDLKSQNAFAQGKGVLSSFVCPQSELPECLLSSYNAQSCKLSPWLKSGNWKAALQTRHTFLLETSKNLVYSRLPYSFLYISRYRIGKDRWLCGKSKLLNKSWFYFCRHKHAVCVCVCILYDCFNTYTSTTYVYLNKIYILLYVY